jgi:hypothetical protein
MKLNYNKLILALLSFILIIVIYKWIDYLVKNNYIIECFQNYSEVIQHSLNSSKSHTVNLPLTTTYSCKNFCGPMSRCSITGHQCTSDVDCPGCTPQMPSITNNTECVPGNNDAGKLTIGVTPQYSKLTTDIGTMAAFYTSNPLKKPAVANFGIDTWTSEFKQTNEMFYKRYKPPNLEFMPSYQNRYTTTGLFVDDGPLASNSYLDHFEN